MTLDKTISKLLSNKNTYYVVLVISVINLIGYLAVSNFNAIVFFALIGVITHQFSKNITVVLLITLIATNLLVSTRLIKEGMTNNKDSTKDKETNKDKDANKDKETKDINDTEHTQGDFEDDDERANSDFKDSAKVKEAVHQLKNGSEKKVETKKPATVSSTRPKPNNPEVIVPLHNESFTSANKAGKKGASRIDFASTLEDAYTNLDNMLGSEGIKNLSSDTKKLMGQQQNLFKSMESMTPLLSQAQEMLKTFDLKSISGLGELANTLNKKKE